MLLSENILILNIRNYKKYLNMGFVLVKSSQLKMVFEGKAIEANYVKSILEDNGMTPLLKNDMLSQLFPLYVFSKDLQPVRVYVDKNEFDRAKQLLRDYFENKDMGD